MKVSVLIPDYDFTETHPDYVRSRSQESKKAGIPYVENPLGLMYLSSALKSAGHEVQMIDGYFNDREGILQKLETFNPDLVGIQATAPFWFRVKNISKQISERLDVPVVVGGSHVRYAGGNIIEDSKYIDYGIVGDGEKAIRGLCKVLNGKKDKKNVDGLFWKENGKICHAEKPEAKVGFDNLPYPDREEFDLYRYRPSNHNLHDY